MFDKIKEIFNKIKQDLSEDEEKFIEEGFTYEDFSDTTFYVQDVQYTPEEWKIVNACKKRLKALGMEEIEIDGLCTQYWLEITEAFELMENTFLCLRGYVKRIQLVEIENSFMFVKNPISIDCNETKYQYKYLTKPTLNISTEFLNPKLAEKDMQELCDNGHSKLNGVYATTIHELSHFLEQVIVVMEHGYDFYDEKLTEDILKERALSFGNHYQSHNDVAKILSYMNMQNMRDRKKEFERKVKLDKNIDDLNELTDFEHAEISKEYFYSVDKILEGYHYAFTNDSEFFAEIIATKIVYGDEADDFVLQYFEIFQNLYHYIFKIEFEDYKQAENKIRYVKYIKSLS